MGKRERGVRLSSTDWGVGMREGLGLVGHCDGFLYAQSGSVVPQRKIEELSCTRM